MKEALGEKRSDQNSIIELISPNESNMNSQTKETERNGKYNLKCPEIEGNPLSKADIQPKRENIPKKHACSKLNSKNDKVSPKKDETKLGINPIEGIADMDAHLRSQMTFVFFCCSSFVMLIVYIGECKSTKLTSVPKIILLIWTANGHYSLISFLEG